MSRQPVGVIAVAALLLAACQPTTVGSATAGPTPPGATTSSLVSPGRPTPSTDAPFSAATPPPTAATTDASSPTAAPPGSALAALATLPVKGRAPKTGYTRALFGQAWADVDRNGCDTRNDVLRRDLTRYVLKAGTNGCLVLSGTLKDPYSGTSVAFIRGAATSAAVQIDHVVALSDAWQKGAQQWTASGRTQFANDPLNLLAVGRRSNDAKSDGDAATWLPPNKVFRCAYVARQVAVKHRYHLWVTSAEKAAIGRVLATCPTQKLPTVGPIALGGGTTAQSPTPTSAPTTAPSSGTTDPRFGTCKAAKAAGYGPYCRGTDPEYAWYRDADHDGIACE